MQRDNPQYSESSIPAESVTAPDFDNETTLRSARRVVPLAKTNHDSHFLLWLCGAVAFLLIGVAIGVLIQFGRGNTSPTADSTPKVTAVDAETNANSPVENTSDLSESSEPDVNQENSASGDVEPEVNQENSASGNNEVDSGMASLKRKDSARLNDDSGGRVSVQNLDKAPDTRTPSNLGPVAKRSRRVTEQTSATNRTNQPDEIFQPSELGTEEQRSRRVIERTPTINRSHARDGIFRIEDIFRGSRRP